MNLNQEIIDNQNMIYHAANYFSGYNDKEALFQAGSLGMIKASKNYNENSKAKFTTYAYPYILGEMKKQIREDKSFKVSREITKLYLKIEKTKMILCQKLNRIPTNIELAQFVGVSEYELSEALNSINNTLSIDEPITDYGKEVNFHDIIAKEEKLDQDLIIMLKEEFQNLNRIEQELIYKRYFLDCTQQEVANDMGISQVQAYRNEQKILKKLREKMKA